MRLRAPRAVTLPPLASSGRGRTTARRGWSIWAYRSLIWNFTQRDLKARYKGTLLGWAWSLVVPLATLLIYTLVFSVIFRAEPPDFGNGEPGIFPVWLFGGLIAWTFLAQSVQLGIPTLLGNGPLLQKVYFPSHVPVLGMMGAILVQTLIELGIYAVDPAPAGQRRASRGCSSLSGWPSTWCSWPPSPSAWPSSTCTSGTSSTSPASPCSSCSS